MEKGALITLIRGLKKEVENGLLYLGDILRGIETVKADHIAGKTMTTDGERIYINEDFFLNPGKSYPEIPINQSKIFLQSVLVHELLHIVFKHMLRDKEAQYMYFLMLDNISKHFNQRNLGIDEKRNLFKIHGFYLWNQATDYAVNGFIVDNNLHITNVSGDRIFLSIIKHGGLYDEKYKNKRAESIYEILLEKEKDIAIKHLSQRDTTNFSQLIKDYFADQGKKVTQELTTIDRHLTSEQIVQIKRQIENDKNVNKTDDEILKQIKERIEQTIITTERNIKRMGSVDNNEDYLGEIFARKQSVKTNASMLIRQAMNTAISVYGRENYKKINRKMTAYFRENLKQDIIFPTKVKEVASVVFVIDVSGSIKDDDLVNFLAMLDKIIKEQGINQIRIIQCDTAIRSDEVYKADYNNFMRLRDIFANNTFLRRGVGGTDFAVALNYINNGRSLLADGKNKDNNVTIPKIVFYVTADGEGFLPDKKKFKFDLYWVINRNADVKTKEMLKNFGKVIEYSAEELSYYQQEKNNDQQNNILSV